MSKEAIEKLIAETIEECYEAEATNGRGWWVSTRIKLEKILNLLRQPNPCNRCNPKVGCNGCKYQPKCKTCDDIGFVGPFKLGYAAELCPEKCRASMLAEKTLREIADCPPAKPEGGGASSPKQDWKLWYDKWLSETCALERRIEQLQAKTTQQAAEIGELKEELKKYGRHQKLCMVRTSGNCSCGFEQALTKEPK